MKSSLDLIDSLFHIATPEQQAFEQLLAAIALEKKRLADWQALADLHQREVLAKYLPLRRRYAEQQAILVQLMDEHLHHERFSPQQTTKLSQLIRLLCEQVLTVIPEPVIETIQQRHVFQPSKTQVAKPKKTPAANVENDDYNAFEAAQQAAAEQRVAYKQAAKQKAQQAREQAVSLKSTQSIRVVYRELVASLHPDREPDPTEQQRKTALMQQVNVAYQEQDLLKLLELQLAAEQIQPRKSKQLAAERLEHYQRVLSKQLTQLQTASQNLELGLKAAAHLHPSELFSSKRLKQSFKADVKLLQQQLTAIQALLNDLREVQNFKLWLNAYELDAD
ncbi:J domain-containing protein [uncultured Thiothrix sp.]|uniref:J domain-containing protein n=1 Tax=uncultured Thiothrix sp. TaxID=223185 RepID=UPI00260EC99D|nr:J domain-containing protein [uncultured Thiothrix sp.]